MKMENKFGSKVGIFILSILFLSHLFVLEKYKNGFLEYDQHFFAFFSLLISLWFLINLWTSRRVNFLWNLDIPGLMAIIFVLYMTTMTYTHQNPDTRYLIFAWLLLLLFYALKSANNYLNQLSIWFVILVLVTVSINISDLQIFPSVFFLKNAAFINSGENANYYASVLPFIFSCMLGKRETGFSKFFFIISLIAFLTCSYMVGASNSRIACIAAFLGVIVVAFKVWNLDKIIFNKIRTFLGRSIIFTLVILMSLFLTKVFYDQNPNSVKGRFLIYEVSSQMIKSNPIWGHGPQSFKVLYNINQSNYLRSNKIPPDKILLADNSYYAFNEFIQMFVEFGVVGLLTISLAVYFSINTSKSNDQYANIQIGAIGALTSIGLCSLFSYPLHTLSVLFNCVFYLAVLSSNSKAIFHFNFKKNTTIFLSITVTILCLYFSVKEYKRIVALRNWEEGAHLALTRTFNEAKTAYKEADKELHNEGPFLYNYGAESFLADLHSQSFLLLKRATLFYSSANLYIYIGNYYKEVKDYKNAELSYEIAEYMQPSRFLPKFQLLLLYQEYGPRSKAIAMAKKIVSFPTKIPSPLVDGYKKYATDFLISKNMD